MKHLIPPILLAFFLAACGASPAPEFFGAQKTEVTRAGRQYVVYQKGERVEIIRSAMPGAVSIRKSAPR